VTDNSDRKKVLRRTMVERIMALDAADRAAEEADLTLRFPTLPGFREARTVLLYVSAFLEEFATGAMLEQALALGKRLVCPRVDRVERRLRLFVVEDLSADLQPGTRGIPEPERHCPEVVADEIDWVLVPGLAFDGQGYRLGRGAGHYDRLLPTLRAEVPRWAMALECQWVDALPVEPHDVPLNGIVSARKTLTRYPDHGGCSD
jgi:5-formyltetrahydrofolate cyclo-ligase